MKSKKSIYSFFVLVAFSALLWCFWPNHLTLKQVEFNKLPAWEQGTFVPSFNAFKRSCAVFLRMPGNKKIGSQQIALQAKDIQPACRKAISMRSIDNSYAKKFFEQWFRPYVFYRGQALDGLFTGYYLPELQGSLKRSEKYSVPIYGMPDDLLRVDLSLFEPDTKKKVVARIEGHKLLPYYSRADINAGAIKGKAQVLAWVDNYIDRFFLEIQGSGRVSLEEGKKLYIGYAGTNGLAYTPLARVLIDKGLMTKENASMQGIRAYVESHPKERDELLHQNQSFVFFRILNQTDAIGAQNIALTQGYSLAVDRQYIPLGMPLWLDTTFPSKKGAKKSLQRLMVAQDTGGAIKGVVRGDVFWGAGAAATFTSGHMKSRGRYYLLLPKR